MEPRALDPARVLADPDACNAFEMLAARLRAAGYDARRSPDHSAAPTLVTLARGDPVSDHETRKALGNDAVDALVRCGALEVTPADVRLTATLFAMRSVYTVLPAH